MPIRRAIALLTGIAVHKGIEQLFQIWKTAITVSEADIEGVIRGIRDWYVEEASKQLVDGKGTQTKEQQVWTIAEQRALIEALIRLWAIWELPRLQVRYDIIHTEKEMTYDLGNGILLQARVDAILQSKKKSSDMFNYSLKTGKRWTSKMEDTFSIDLQTLTEMEVTNHTFKDIRVMGTIFCHLIKGDREEIPETGNWVTKNPFTYGYRKAGIGKVDYAHSYWFPNPQNPSGKGRLGTGWQPFHIWSRKNGYEGGVKQWMEDIRNCKIQTDFNPTDLFNQWCVVPVEIFRSTAEVKQAMDEIRQQERTVFHHLYNASLPIKTVFPMYRKSCFWPTDCEYLPICHQREPFTKQTCGPDVATDPIGTGYYEKRVPHHELVTED